MTILNLTTQNQIVKKHFFAVTTAQTAGPRISPIKPTIVRSTVPPQVALFFTYYKATYQNGYTNLDKTASVLAVRVLTAI